jgi:tetrahydromethanopterin S-methyltransferase subunit F
VYPGIEDRLGELGFRFKHISRRRTVKDADGKLVVEIDLFLENDTTIFAVEAKAKPSAKDIKRQVEKLEKLRECIGRENDNRRIMGAIAGAVFGTDQRLAALEAGFFVIVQSGDTMQMDIPEGFKPREW